MRFFDLSLVLISISLQAQSTPPTAVYHDYQFPDKPSVVKATNEKWESAGLKNRLLSQKIGYRISQNSVSSIYGYFVMQCDAKSPQRVVEIVFSVHSEVKGAVEKDLVDKGLSPAGIDSAFLFLTNHRSAQEQLQETIDTALIIPCTVEDPQIILDHFAISLWVNHDSGHYDVTGASVDATHFDQIR